MSRHARVIESNVVYHVLNRGVRRAVLFESDRDYLAFETVLVQTLQRVSIRLLAYCAMPNHWHLVLWPADTVQLPKFMHRLTGTHALRWHSSRASAGTGHVYQGRYKSIRVSSENRLLNVCRYVERNPVRAGLVERAENWRWSSLWRRSNLCDADILAPWPCAIPDDWVAIVNNVPAPWPIE